MVELRHEIERGREAHHGLAVLQRFTACGGRAVVLGRRLGEAGPTAETVELSLAATLGAFDEKDQRVPVVVLRLAHRDDAKWARPALHWLSARGRRVVLRSAVALARDLVDEALAWGSTILLEVASPDPKLQRALLGEGADSVSALLLHAQHLRARGLDVAVQLGPVLPGIHDRQEIMESLWRHVAAADIRDAHVSIGHLSSGRLAALERVLPPSQVLGIARQYGLGLPVDQGPVLVPRGKARLDRLTAAHLFHAVRRMAESVQVRVDRCGCPAQCHLDPERVGDYVDLTTADLFATVSETAG
jgi:hypothetical protein